MEDDDSDENRNDLSDASSESDVDNDNNSSSDDSSVSSDSDDDAELSPRVTYHDFINNPDADTRSSIRIPVDCFPDDAGEWGALGYHIAKSSVLNELSVHFWERYLGIQSHLHVSSESFEMFCMMLNYNTSIKELCLGARSFFGGATFRWITPFFEKNRNLQTLYIVHDDRFFRDSINDFIGTLQATKPSFKKIALQYVFIGDDSIQDLCRGFLACPALEEVSLIGNRIGQEGCHHLASMLKNPRCNLVELLLRHNSGMDGYAAMILLNALANDNKLRELHLDREELSNVDQDAVVRMLCCTNSINGTFLSSNHTLERLVDEESEAVWFEVEGPWYGDKLHSYLLMNRDRNKEHVAIRKVLLCHSNLNMELLFEWDLGMLPHVIGWFERARVCPSVDVANINARVLSVVFQFARSMPMMFVPGIQARVRKEAGREKSEVEYILPLG